MYKQEMISTIIAIFIIIFFIVMFFTWPAMFAVDIMTTKNPCCVAVIYNDKCKYSRRAREHLSNLPWLSWINVKHIPTIGVPTCDGKFTQELFSSGKRITAGSQASVLQANYISFLKKKFDFRGMTPHFCQVKDGQIVASCTGFPCSWYS